MQNFLFYWSNLLLQHATLNSNKTKTSDHFFHHWGFLILIKDERKNSKLSFIWAFSLSPPTYSTSSSSHKDMFNGSTNTEQIDWQQPITSASLCRIDQQARLVSFLWLAVLQVMKHALTLPWIQMAHTSPEPLQMSPVMQGHTESEGQRAVWGKHTLERILPSGWTISSCWDVSCYKMAIMSFDRFASPPLAGFNMSALQVHIFKGEAGKTTWTKSPFHNV